MLVTSLLELDSSLEVEQVTVAYPDAEWITPDLTPQEVAPIGG